MQATRGKLVTEQGDIVDGMRACRALPDAAASPHSSPVDTCLSQLERVLIAASAGNFANYGIL
jgi:hypothetical protein